MSRSVKAIDSQRTDSCPPNDQPKLSKEEMQPTFRSLLHMVAPRTSFLLFVNNVKFYFSLLKALITYLHVLRKIQLR